MICNLLEVQSSVEFAVLELTACHAHRTTPRSIRPCQEHSRRVRLLHRPLQYHKKTSTQQLSDHLHEHVVLHQSLILLSIQYPGSLPRVEEELGYDGHEPIDELKNSPVQPWERPDGCKDGVAEGGGRSSGLKMECRRLGLLEVLHGVTDHGLVF